jgi:hypothetical protein
VFLDRSNGENGSLLGRELREVCIESFWCGQDRAHALNQSSGGMCFRVARRVNPGEMLTLSFGPCDEVTGRVAWTRRLHDCTEVGLEYYDDTLKISHWRDLLDKSSEKEPVLALPAPRSYYG